MQARSSPGSFCVHITTWEVAACTQSPGLCPCFFVLTVASATWARLKAHVEKLDRPDVALPHHERIDDKVFRRAVDLLDAGDIDGLRMHLGAHPALVLQRVVFEGGNYLRSPTLLDHL